MNQKLPTNVKPQQAIKALSRLGFTAYKSRGSHLRLKHADGRWTQIAIHPRPIPSGTLNKILHQAEIDVEKFLENLRS